MPTIRPTYFTPTAISTSQPLDSPTVAPSSVLMLEPTPSPLSSSDCIFHWESPHPYTNHFTYRSGPISQYRINYYRLVFSGETETESGYDFFTVYDGDEQLWSNDGNSWPEITLRTSGSIFIEFTSDSSVTKWGIDVCVYAEGWPSQPSPIPSLQPSPIPSLQPSSDPSTFLPSIIQSSIPTFTAPSGPCDGFCVGNRLHCLHLVSPQILFNFYILYSITYHIYTHNSNIKDDGGIFPYGCAWWDMDDGNGGLKEHYCLKSGGCIYASSSEGLSNDSDRCCYLNCQEPSAPTPSVLPTPVPSARPSSSEYLEVLSGDIVCGDRVLINVEYATSYFVMFHPDHNLEAALGDKVNMYIPDTLLVHATFPNPQTGALAGLDDTEPFLLQASSFEISCSTRRENHHEPMNYRILVF